MGIGQGVGETAGPSFPRQFVDALAHAVALAAVVFLAAAAVSFALGGDWVGVKYLLFLVGFFALGVGGLFLRPTPLWRDSPLVSRSGPTPFERAVDRLLGGYALDPADRFPSSARVLLAGFLMLAVSFLMETAFGVAI